MWFGIAPQKNAPFRGSGKPPRAHVFFPERETKWKDHRNDIPVLVVAMLKIW